jgi:deoxyribose-phosphate aldolase
MASLIFNSFWEDLARGAIDLDTDTFKVLLTTSAYTEDKDTHTKRSAVTNEVTGTGYSAGGNTLSALTITKDTANDRLDVTFPSTSWSSSTITARKAVIYKSRGGASSADELVAVIDFGSDVVSSSGTFSLNSSLIRVQN